MTTLPKTADAFHAEVKQLIAAGRFTRAFELSRVGLSEYPEDPWLRYDLALALARGGNSQLAQQYLAPLLEREDLPPACRSDGLSLAGRLAKDRFEPTSDMAAAHEAAQHLDVESKQGQGTMTSVTLGLVGSPSLISRVTHLAGRHTHQFDA